MILCILMLISVALSGADPSDCFFMKGSSAVYKLNTAGEIVYRYPTGLVSGDKKHLMIHNSTHETWSVHDTRDNFVSLRYNCKPAEIIATLFVGGKAYTALCKGYETFLECVNEQPLLLDNCLLSGIAVVYPKQLSAMIVGVHTYRNPERKEDVGRSQLVGISVEEKRIFSLWAYPHLIRLLSTSEKYVAALDFENILYWGMITPQGQYQPTKVIDINASPSIKIKGSQLPHTIYLASSDECVVTSRGLQTVITNPEHCQYNANFYHIVDMMIRNNNQLWVMLRDSDSVELITV